MTINLTSNICAILLAAGASHRMGDANKLLLPINNKKLIHYPIHALLNSKIADLYIVLGYQAKTMQTYIHAVVNQQKTKKIEMLIATNWQLGMGHSLARAIHILPNTITAALVMLADMPAITSVEINHLLDHFSEGNFIIPTYQGVLGNPIIIPRKFFPQLHEIRHSKIVNNQGARNLINANPQHVVKVNFKTQAILQDIDTKSDFKAFFGQ